MGKHIDPRLVRRFAREHISKLPKYDPPYDPFNLDEYVKTLPSRSTLDGANKTLDGLMLFDNLYYLRPVIMGSGHWRLV